jgi:hypothetical protein
MNCRECFDANWLREVIVLCSSIEATIRDFNDAFGSGDSSDKRALFFNDGFWSKVTRGRASDMREYVKHLSSGIDPICVIARFAGPTLYREIELVDHGRKASSRCGLDRTGLDKSLSAAGWTIPASRSIEFERLWLADEGFSILPEVDRSERNRIGWSFGRVYRNPGIKKLIKDILKQELALSTKDVYWNFVFAGDKLQPNYGPETGTWMMIVGNKAEFPMSGTIVRVPDEDAAKSMFALIGHEKTKIVASPSSPGRKKDKTK